MKSCVVQMSLTGTCRMVRRNGWLPGAYICVVTAKSVSGKLTQKIGAVTVAENSVSVQTGTRNSYHLQQAQAIGPVEENSSWTIGAEDEPQTPP